MQVLKLVIWSDTNDGILARNLIDVMRQDASLQLLELVIWSDISDNMIRSYGSSIQHTATQPLKHTATQTLKHTATHWNNWNTATETQSLQHTATQPLKQIETHRNTTLSLTSHRSLRTKIAKFSGSVFHWVECWSETVLSTPVQC